jgi:hypothetical protein
MTRQRHDIEATLLRLIALLLTALVWFALYRLAEYMW